MALQSVIKIDHTLSISISIWVVDQSLAHDQQKVIKRSNRSRSAIDHHKSESILSYLINLYIIDILHDLSLRRHSHLPYFIGSRLK